MVSCEQIEFMKKMCTYAITYNSNEVDTYEQGYYYYKSILQCILMILSDSAVVDGLFVD